MNRQPQIRRHSTGAIDVAYYQREAGRLRSEAMVDCFKSVKGLTRLLFGVAIMVGPLALAALLHGIVEPGSMQHTVAQVSLQQVDVR